MIFWQEVYERTTARIEELKIIKEESQSSHVRWWANNLIETNQEWRFGATCMLKGNK